MNNYNDEKYTNDLVDRYKETNSMELMEELLDNFSPYFKKYVNLMCGKHSVDVTNADTVKFLRLFMSAEERNDNYKYIQACNRCINSFRKVFSDFTTRDLYDELVVIFLDALEKYKPMIANHKATKERISFVHYIQVTMRYRLKALAMTKSRDALSIKENLPYNEAIYKVAKVGPSSEALDLRWVHGFTAGDVFKHLSKSERYILWLKYESDPDGRELSSRGIANITGLHHKTVLGRIGKIRGKLKKFIL